MGDLRGGLRGIGVHSGRFGTGQWTLGEVRDRSKDHQGGTGDPQGAPETGWRTLGKVQDGSGEPQGGPGRVQGPLEKSGTGRWTLGEVRDRPGALGEVGTGRGTLGDFRDRSLNSWIGPGHVVGPLEWSKTVRWTLE